MVWLRLVSCGRNRAGFIQRGERVESRVVVLPTRFSIRQRGKPSSVQNLEMGTVGDVSPDILRGDV